MGRGGGRRSSPHPSLGEGGGSKWSVLAGVDGGSGSDGGEVLPAPPKAELAAFLGRLLDGEVGCSSGRRRAAKSSDKPAVGAGVPAAAAGALASAGVKGGGRSSSVSGSEGGCDPGRFGGGCVAALGGCMDGSGDERTRAALARAAGKRPVVEAVGFEPGPCGLGGDEDVRAAWVRAEERAAARAKRHERKAERAAAREAAVALLRAGGGTSADACPASETCGPVCTDAGSMASLPEAPFLSGGMADAACALASPSAARALAVAECGAPIPMECAPAPPLGAHPTSRDALGRLSPLGPAQQGWQSLSSACPGGPGGAAGPPLPLQGPDFVDGASLDRPPVGPKANAWATPKFIPISLKEGSSPVAADGKSVVLDPVRIQSNLQKLERGLVGHTFGRKLPHHILKAALDRRWASFGEFRLITLSSECFICIFSSEVARDAILMKGPWTIAGQVIGLDRWTPSFNPKNPQRLMSPIWVRFPSLPLLYWDNDSIARMASRIGDPLWVDSQTNDWGRSTYARVCVRVDLSKQLSHGVWVQGINGSFYQRVEYEGISLLCFHCGMVGHKREQCSKVKAPVPPPPVGRPTPADLDGLAPPTLAPPSALPAESQQEGFGAWTVVARRPRKPPPKKAPPPVVPSKELGSPCVRPPASRVSESCPAAPMGEEVCLSKDDLLPGRSPPFRFAGGASSSSSGSSFSKIGPSKSVSFSFKKARESRISAAHFQKELAQLGPLIPKKRSKVPSPVADTGDPSTSVPQ